MTTETRVTIRDVAKRVGMSLGTVSGVLNGSDRFSETTRKRVWDAALAMDYTPNRQAQTLRSVVTGGRTRTGVIMHVSHLGTETPLGDAFEAERSLLLAWLAQQRGMYPISYWYRRRSGFQCPPVLNGYVDGAIVGTPHAEVVDILEKKVPVVLMDVPFSQDVADVPMVNADWRHGIGSLMAQLADMGHRNLGLVYSTNGGDGVSTEAPKVRIMEETARLAGMNIPEGGDLSDNIVPENHDRMMRELAEACVTLIREQRLTAIVASGEFYAISLRENLLQRGIRVPEDVTIAMTSSGQEGSSSAIAKVTIDWSAMIQTALDVLAAQIGGTSLLCREYSVPVNVIPGASMGPLPTRR